MGLLPERNDPEGTVRLLVNLDADGVGLAFSSELCQRIRLTVMLP